jgi:hypothetical protein
MWSLEMLLLKQKLGSIVLLALISTMLLATSWAEVLVMPRELVEYSRTQGCAAIEDFYERPGMVNPPYAYGWAPGDPENSAVFWCKKETKNDKSYVLMFKARDPKQLAGCPAAIEWQNPPAGLSIETRPRLPLTAFRHVTAPEKSGPPLVVRNARVVVNYYDGLTDVLYCHKGQWLVMSTE